MKVRHNVDVWLRLCPSTAVSQMAAIKREQMEKGSPLRSELTQTHVENGAVQSSPKKCPFKSQNAAVPRPTARVPLQTDRSRSHADTTAQKLPLAKSAEPSVRPESRTHVLDGHAVIGEPRRTVTKYTLSL